MPLSPSPGGRPFTIKSGCIDTGGANTQAVYNFTKARLRRLIWGIKGASDSGGQRAPVWPTSIPLHKNRAKYRPVQIGTNSAKDSIRSRLHLEKPGSGYMHFPSDRDRAYFSQLTAERLIRKEARGRGFFVWDCPKNRANEALDCRVYAFAAMVGLQQGGISLNRTADEVGAAYTVVEVPVDRPAVDARPGADPIPSTEPETRLVKVGEAPARPPVGSRASRLAS